MAQSKQFKYKVLDKNNKVREGVIEGEDIQKVGTSLVDQGFYILDLKSKGISAESLKTFNVGGIPFKEKVVFMRQLSFMINAGLPLTQALEIASNQIQNVKFKEIVTHALKDVQSGISMSKAFEKHQKVFGRVAINLIRAGEESGKLDAILERVAEDMEKKQEFDGKVRGALIYPVIILIAIALVIVLLLVYMIPQMQSLFADRDQALPTPTQIVVNASEFTRGWGGGITGIAIIAGVIALIYYRRTPSGRLVTDAALLKMPIFGIFSVKAQVASFARTFSMLIGAGVPILDALKLVADSTTNSVFRKIIEDARKKVEKGVPLSQPILASQTFPPLVGHMLKVGEETGAMDKVVEKVGNQFAREVNQMADNLTKLMEPIILLVMGGIVGVLAIAVYLPIFSLGSVVSGLN